MNENAPGIDFTSMVRILAVGLFGATWIAGIVGTTGEQALSLI